MHYLCISVKLLILCMCICIYVCPYVLIYVQHIRMYVLTVGSKKYCFMIVCLIYCGVSHIETGVLLTENLS